MKTLHILDNTGDTQIDLEVDTDLARQLFTEAQQNGKLIYGVIGSHNELMRDFTTAVDKIVIAPNYVGG